MPTIFKDIVTLGALSFNDGSTPIRCDVLDGWIDTADLNVIINDRGVSDGAEWGPRFPTKEKYLEIGGYCVSPDRGSASLMRDLLVTYLPRNEDLVLQRYEPPTAKQMVVRRASKISFFDHAEGFRFTTTLVAKDARKYGLNIQSVTVGISAPGVVGRIYPRTNPFANVAIGSTTSNARSIYNEGTAPSDPISTATGPLVAGWRAVNETTGESIAFDIDVPSGQNLVIDHANHTATLNGFPVQFEYSGTWWSIVPGNNRINLAGGDYNPSASLTVVARPAWE